MKILLTGGTGFLGTLLADELIRRGHELIMSTRSLPETWNPYPAQFVKWPLDTNELAPHLENIEACIHLVGEPVADKKWTAKQKDKIYNSRIQGTREVVDVLRQAPRLKTFLSSSGIGYYGNRADQELVEGSLSGIGFLAEVCRDWENEASKLSATPGHENVRTVQFRTGVVLDRGSGFLGQLEPIFRAHLGGPIGSGNQYISWIHVQDWTNAIIHCLENEKLKGPVNVTSPDPCTNRTFTYTYGELFNQKIFIPIPEFALKLKMGRMAEVALDSQKVFPRRLQESGFKFQFPELKTALTHLYDLNELNPKVDDLYQARQWVPAPIDQVFKFFGDVQNLEKMAPPEVDFKVIRKSSVELQKGTLIDYKLKIHGIPISWRTRIESWTPNKQFSDTQQYGPYKKWFHTHDFESLRGGTLIKDKVLYRLPIGPLGRMGGLWMVKKDLANIFAYRRKVLREVFPAAL